MRYPADLLDEIRSRVPVSRVVERHVKLKRAGREYIGLSPFKTEETPSFTVNDHKGFYHCFASGEHGDVFTFLMKVEGLAFPKPWSGLPPRQALSCPLRNLSMKPRRATRPAFGTRWKKRAAFLKPRSRAARGALARTYLEKRGVQLSEIKIFRLGYAPDNKSALKQHLGGKGLFACRDAGCRSFDPRRRYCDSL